ncbi:trigger factor [Treponema zuelzerae]|uniref:Trigger factor n=1 Tax=Teretinema zuelzerae TaxID=156 RepID=A0AAE3EI84_9SPIR|nr:trigger factor [Teretinema zuelzerae]MBN2810767.1 trigger factor [Spirochaetales bacterium]MCD1654886.1 trigger factor [Teretinema zuelzerae]
MNLNKQFTKLEKSRVQLDVTIGKEEIAKGYSDLLQKYSRTMQLPGFRKGKVPVAVLEKKYGEALKGDVAGDIMEKALGEIFEASNEHERPLPYSQPVLDKAPEFDLEKDLSFSVTYDVFPEVKLGKVDGFKLALPVVAIGDAEMKEELEAIRERNAIVVDCNDGDKAKKDFIATVNYSELDDSGAEIAGTQRQDFVFTIGTGYNIFKFDDEVVGMKKGQTKDFTKSFPADFEDKDLAGTTKKLRVTLTALKARNLPALDDELAQDVNEKFKTLDDLKADIKKNMETALENKMKELRSNALLEKIVEENSFELPESMIGAELESRWQMLAQRFRTDAAQLEKLMIASGQSKASMLESWRSEAEKLLKSRVVVELLLKDREIAVTPEDVEAEFAKIAEGAAISVEEVKKHYADPRRKEYLIDDIKEQRLYAQLLEKCTITKGAKTAFADLFKNEQ